MLTFKSCSAFISIIFKSDEIEIDSLAVLISFLLSPSNPRAAVLLTKLEVCEIR